MKYIFFYYIFVYIFNLGDFGRVGGMECPKKIPWVGTPIIRLDRASRVLSARIPRKKSQAKKIPSVLSVETAYEAIPRRSVPKDQTSTEPFSRSNNSHIKRHNVTINRNRNAIYHFRSIAIKTQSECPPKISTPFQFYGSTIEN